MLNANPTFDEDIQWILTPLSDLSFCYIKHLDKISITAKITFIFKISMNGTTFFSTKFASSYLVLLSLRKVPVYVKNGKFRLYSTNSGDMQISR